MTAEEIIAELEKMSAEERQEVARALQKYPRPPTGRPRLKLSEVLLKHAGKAEELPADVSVNRDHYLYGTPKRDSQTGLCAEQPDFEPI